MSATSARIPGSKLMTRGGEASPKAANDLNTPSGQIMRSTNHVARLTCARLGLQAKQRPDSQRRRSVSPSGEWALRPRQTDRYAYAHGASGRGNSAVPARGYVAWPGAQRQGHRAMDRDGGYDSRLLMHHDAAYSTPAVCLVQERLLGSAASLAEQGSR